MVVYKTVHSRSTEMYRKHVHRNSVLLRKNKRTQYLEVVSAGQLKLLGFVRNVYHGRRQSRRVSACNVSQQSAPVSHFHRVAVTLRIKVKFLADVVPRTRVWMCVSSRVVQSTMPTQCY